MTSWRLGLIFILPFSLAAQSGTLTTRGKMRVHAKRIVEPYRFAGVAATAGIQQLRDTPSEWGQGAAGYGRRYLSDEGFVAAKNVFGFGLDATLRQDPRYFPSKNRRFWPRTWNAISQTFITHTDSGGRSISYWRIGGSYGAGLLSNAWYPDRMNSVGDGLVRGSISLGFEAVSNLASEFWPDVKKKLWGRKK